MFTKEKTLKISCLTLVMSSNDKIFFLFGFLFSSLCLEFLSCIFHVVFRSSCTVY